MAREALVTLVLASLATAPLFVPPADAEGTTSTTLLFHGGSGDAWLSDVYAPALDDWRRDALGTWSLDLRVTVEGVAPGGLGVVSFDQLVGDSDEARFPFMPGVYEGGGGFDVQLSSTREPVGARFSLIVAADDATSLTARVVVNPAYPVLRTIEAPAARSGNGVEVGLFARFADAARGEIRNVSKGVETEESTESTVGPLAVGHAFGLRYASVADGLHFATLSASYGEGLGEWEAETALGDERLWNDGYLYGLGVAGSGASATMSGTGAGALAELRLDDAADASPGIYANAASIDASPDALGVRYPTSMSISETAPAGHLGPSCLRDAPGSLVACAMPLR